MKNFSILTDKDGHTILPVTLGKLVYTEKDLTVLELLQSYDKRIKELEKILASSKHFNKVDYEAITLEPIFSTNLEVLAYNVIECIES